MKTIFKVLSIILIFAIGAIIPYIIGSFTAWNMNPQDWGVVGRFLIIILSFLSGFGAIALFTQLID